MGGADYALGIAVLFLAMLSGYLYVQNRRMRKIIAAVVAEAESLVDQTQELIRDTYRANLSCPLCDWTDLVVREDHAAAMEAGTLRIAQHNVEAGHEITGTPRAGYWKGEPIN